MKRLERQIISFLCAALLLLQLGGGACALTDGDQLPEEIPERQEEELQTEDREVENTDAIDGQSLPEGGGEAQSSDDDPAPEGNNVSQVEEPQTLPTPAGNNASQVEEPKTLSVPEGNNVSQVEEPKTLSVPEGNIVSQAEEPQTLLAPAGNNVSQAEEPQTLPAPAENIVSQTEEPQTLPAPAGNRMLLFSAQAPAAQTDASGGDAGETDGAASASTLTVAGQSFSSTEDSSGNGWTYDAQDGSLVLVNYDGSEQSVSTAGGGITIKAAGVNRLAKLSVDGSVDLIGTGILLVDEIEMPEDSSFNLHANTEIYGDDEGSVAVFLKQEDGSYLLMNGGVSGILDESYTLPAGVTLVVPDDSTLVMQSLAIGELVVDGAPVQVEYSTVGERQAKNPLSAAQTERNDAGLDPGTVEFSSTAAQLTIPETAKLIVESAAKLVLNHISRLYSGSLVPKLTVAGALELEGSVSGGAVVLEGENALSGNGVIHDARISALADQTAITAAGSRIILANKTETGTMALSGQNSIYYSGEAKVGTLKLDGGGVSAASFSPLDETGHHNTLTVDTIIGSGSILYQNGNITVGTNSSDGGVTETATTGGVIVRNAGTEQEEVFVVGPSGLIPVSGSGAAYSDGHYSFPVVKVFIGGARQVDGSVTESVGPNGEDAETVYSFGSGSTAVSLSQLREALLPTEEIENNGENKWGNNWIEIYYADDSGKLQRRVLTEVDQLDGETMDASRISLIRAATAIYVANGSGGGSSTSTDTSFTGSGILGGSGAGSVKGGTGTSITIPKTAPENHNSGAGETGKTEETQGEEPAAPGQTAKLWVEEREADSPYVLHMEADGREITDPEGSVEVRMDYRPTPVQEGQKLYVVFRLPDGSLKAYAARYDTAEGQLIFETELLGKFTVVAFDFEGEEFSDLFYELLAQLREVQEII